MKYIISTFSLIVGVFSNFLVFTDLGNQIFQKANNFFEYNHSLILSCIALIIAMFSLVKYKERIISTLAIIANLIYIGYFILLFVALG